MLRSDLEHVVRAACDVLGQEQVIVLGSQSILGTYSEHELPEINTLSTEADVRPLTDDERERLADVIDGALGEFSLFHTTNGFYAQGVGKNTSILPSGWIDRLVPVCNENTSYCTGWCLDVHDLCVSKLLANREKDKEFVAGLIRADLVSTKVLRQRIDTTTTDERRKTRAKSFVESFPRNADRYVAPALPYVDLDDPAHPRNLMKPEEAPTTESDKQPGED